MTEGDQISAGLQLAAVFLGGVAVLWGILAAYTVAFPGPSGEWAGLAVYASYVVSVPLGLAALGVGLSVRRGSRRLRGISIAVSVFALFLPILASPTAWGQRR